MTPPRPPPLPWGVAAAFLVFLASLAMPAWENYEPLGYPGRTDSPPDRYLGWECAKWSANFLIEVLQQKDEELLKASFTIPNLLMLCVPGLPIIRPERRRLWPAVAASIASVHVFYWSFARHETGERILIGYWFWLASFVTLAASLWLWEARVRRAASSAATEAEDGDSDNVELK